MLFANWLDVPDAMAFLDAYAEAAETRRGWKLESIKVDYGYQFIYVRYTGRKFAGKGLMASAFVPIHQYRNCQGAVLAHVDVPPIRTPSASQGRSSVRRGNRPSPATADLRLALRVPMGQLQPLERVNLTLRADEWPTHVCFDQSANRLRAPLMNAVKVCLGRKRPRLCLMRHAEC